MEHQFVNYGRGLKLERAAASTNNASFKPDDMDSPAATTIPNGGYSRTIAGHDCIDLMFEFVFAAPATGSVLVEKCADQDATLGGDTYDTINVTAQTSANWNSGEPLLGFFRVHNTSGQSLTCYWNKNVST